MLYLIYLFAKYLSKDRLQSERTFLWTEYWCSFLRVTGSQKRTVIVINETINVLDGCFAVVAHSRTLKESDVRCADSTHRRTASGVEFLSLPPLRYYQGEAKPSIRTVWGSSRLELSFISNYMLIIQPLRMRLYSERLDIMNYTFYLELLFAYLL